MNGYAKVYGKDVGPWDVKILRKHEKTSGCLICLSQDIGPVGVLGPGASFGEAALLGLLHVRTATVQAVQDGAFQPETSGLMSEDPKDQILNTR